MSRVLVVATSRKTRGGITSVVKAHETGEQWKKYHCKWIETHRDGPAWRKILYLVIALTEYLCLLPFADIVHIHVGLRVSVTRKLIFAKIAKFFGKKIIIHFHPATEKHLFDGNFSSEIKTLFNYSDKLLVLSPQWIKWINMAYPDNSYDMEVVYNPCTEVRRKDWSLREKYILFAGSIIDRKGYKQLLKAFAEIANLYPDWKIKFAGNGEIENAKKLQKSLNLPKEQVEYLGWISGEEKDRAFQYASIYCLPSWGEGFPMGVLDAIAYGIPVITTSVGGITDVIHDGVEGLICETYNLDSLVNCLKRLMESEILRKRIVENADKLKETVFNLRNSCEHIGNIYAELSV